MIPFESICFIGYKIPKIGINIIRSVSNILTILTLSACIILINVNIHKKSAVKANMILIYIPMPSMFGNLLVILLKEK